MAAGSLLALLDDVATILDDVAILTKAAAQKTAGVLGDDLALNAQQVAGVRAEREIPVVWAVAKGSFVNKLILVPLALLISAFVPWAITPMLMLGGAYLCFEGAEKLWHKLAHRSESEDDKKALTQAFEDPVTDLVAFEKEKIKGAVRTDFVLSAEIIVISLGTVATAPLSTRISVLSLVAILMTIGVYGIVAAIVKLDDAGLYLHGRQSRSLRNLGGVLLAAAPRLMKLLMILGTAAMFVVGGGILRHGLHLLPDLNGAYGLLADAGMGVIAGGLLVLTLGLFGRR